MSAKLLYGYIRKSTAYGPMSNVWGHRRAGSRLPAAHSPVQNSGVLRVLDLSVREGQRIAVIECFTLYRYRVTRRIWICGASQLTVTRQSDGDEKRCHATRRTSRSAEAGTVYCRLSYRIVYRTTSRNNYSYSVDVTIERDADRTCLLFGAVLRWCHARRISNCGKMKFRTSP